MNKNVCKEKTGPGDTDGQEKLTCMTSWVNSILIGSGRSTMISFSTLISTTSWRSLAFLSPSCNTHMQAYFYFLHVCTGSNKIKCITCERNCRTLRPSDTSCGDWEQTAAHLKQGVVFVEGDGHFAFICGWFHSRGNIDRGCRWKKLKA